MLAENEFAFFFKRNFIFAYGIFQLVTISDEGDIERIVVSIEEIQADEKFVFRFIEKIFV